MRNRTHMQGMKGTKEPYLSGILLDLDEKIEIYDVSSSLRASVYLLAFIVTKRY